MRKTNKDIFKIFLQAQSAVLIHLGAWNPLKTKDKVGAKKPKFVIVCLLFSKIFELLT